MTRPGPSRVAVLRARPLDDMGCAVPALRALRQVMPAAHVTLIGLPAAAAFASRFPVFIDEFVPLPLESDGFARFVAAMHERQFDLAIPMQRGRAAEVLLELIGVRRFTPLRQADRRRVASDRIRRRGRRRRDVVLPEDSC